MKTQANQTARKNLCSNRRRNYPVIALGLLLTVPLANSAMAQPAIPNAPSAVRKQPTPPVLLGYYWSAFAGPVADKGDSTHGGGMVGVSLGGLIAHKTLRAFTFPGFDMELAAVQPTQPGQKLDGIFSFDLQPTFAASERSTFAPYLTGGYSRVFTTGNAINYGAGVNLLLHDKADAIRVLRIEARDYWTFASERQHLITLRVAICFGVPDE